MNYNCTLHQEFQELWPKLNAVIDGGKIKDTDFPECRLGSSVINFSIPGCYQVIRQGRYVNITMTSILMTFCICSSYEKILKILTEHKLKEYVE